MKKSNRKMIEYFILITVIFNTILPFVNIVTKTENLFETSIPFVGSYAQYFLVGWYINNYNIVRKKRGLIYLLASVMLVFEIIATIFFSYFYKHIPQLNYPDGVIVKSFFDIAMFPSFCVMCGLFLALKQLENKLVKLNNKQLLKEIAGLTFGIYLIHPFLIAWVLDPFNQLFIRGPLFIKIILDPLYIYIFSGIIVFLIRKLKFLKWLMP